MSSFSRQESSPHTMQSDLADRCQDAGCLATPATDKLCQRVQLWLCSHHTYKHDNKTLLRPEVPVGDTDTDTDTLHRWPSGLDSLCGGELGALLSMPRCGGKTSFLVALCAALGPQPATGSPSEAHTQSPPPSPLPFSPLSLSLPLQRDPQLRARRLSRRHATMGCMGLICVLGASSKRARSSASITHGVPFSAPLGKNMSAASAYGMSTLKSILVSAVTMSFSP